MSKKQGTARTPGASIRRRLVILPCLLAMCGIAESAPAAECVFPDNVNWIVDASCEVSAIRIAPRSLSVTGGAVLTVESSGEIILDMRRFRIDVDPDARIVVEPGGRIRSNQIGPLLVRRVDGGTFGYFLKRVGGSVLDTINPDLSFHPSSTIKTLYLIEALRQVDAGTLNLATLLNSCPGIDTDGDSLPDDFTLVAGGGQTCPVSFSQATAGGGGGNCNVAANTLANCGFAPINYSLGLGLCGMMKVSNNPAANAIQELVGGGNPQTGWNNMLNNAGAAIGLSATSFGNRMGCGGPNNPAPVNQTTLRDLGLMFEQMATNPSVLFPSNPPTPFNFPATNAYNFMDNHVNELNNTNIPAVVNEQAGEMGLGAATINNFVAAVRLVHKGGSNNTSNTNPVFRTIAGWVSFPIDGGADTRDYVYGVFVNTATPSVDTDGDGMNEDIALRSLLDDASQMLRPVIRDALEAF